MPKGNLKRCKLVSKKTRRGGGSHSGVGKESNYLASSYYENDEWYDLNEVDDEQYTKEEEKDITDICYDNTKSQSSTDQKQPAVTQSKMEEGKCAICLEHRPLIKMMKKCQHQGACFPCLRDFYVTHAQDNVSQYPPRCFDPSCRSLVQVSRLQTMGIIATPQELQRHYRMKVLSKSFKSRAIIGHCPYCDHPRHFTAPLTAKRTDSFKIHTFTCRQCQKSFVIEEAGSPYEAIGGLTTEALKSFQPDQFGGNNGWARCPNCGILISKGDGCDHMLCYCGFDFSWNETQKTTKHCHHKAAENVTYHNFES